MALRRVARVTRKSKAKPIKPEPSVFFDRVEELRQDPRIKQEIIDYRKEQKRIKKGSE